jgi:hypothetical protein
MHASRDRHGWGGDEWDGLAEDDADDPDSFDGDDPGDPAIVPCPFCRQEILEDAPRCPHCERYLSDEDHARSRTPRWVLVTAIVCLAAAVWMALAVI